MYVDFYMSNYHGWKSTFTTTAEEGLSGLPFTWVRKRSQCASTLNILYTRVILFLFQYVYVLRNHAVTTGRNCAQWELQNL